MSGILRDNGSSTGAASGLWLEDVHVSNVTGMPVKTVGFPYPGLVAPYTQFCASGVTFTNVRYVVMKNVEIDHADAPIFLWGRQHYWFTGNNWHHFYVNTAILTGFPDIGIAGFAGNWEPTNMLFENSTASEFAYAASPVSGYGPGYPKGESGPMFANVTHTIVRNLEVSAVHIHNADAVPIDIEGHSADSSGNVPPWTMLIANSNFHNNDGTGFLENDTVFDPNAMMLIDNNAFTTNGTAGFPHPSVFAGRTIGDAWYFTRNNVTKGNAGQKTFAGDASNAYSPSYDTPPTGKVFGASNNVHFP